MNSKMEVSVIILGVLFNMTGRLIYIRIFDGVKDNNFQQ